MDLRCYIGDIFFYFYAQINKNQIKKELFNNMLE